MPVLSVAASTAPAALAALRQMPLSELDQWLVVSRHTLAKNYFRLDALLTKDTPGKGQP